MHGTTVLCVRKDSKVVLAADGQVTLGEGVIKHNAKKVRRLYNDKILAGFAGSTADALSLFARFENKLQEFHGNLPRAAVELAKEWRTDRSLRHLDALLVVADAKSTFLLSGNGDVIEPDDGLCERVMNALRAHGVEFRRGTAGGGNQVRQPYLRRLLGPDEWRKYPRADHVHFYGLYIGNYPSLERERVLRLCELLNGLVA